MERRGSRRGAMVGLVLAAFVVAGCAGSDETRTVRITRNAEGVSGYTPDTVTVQKDDHVELVVQNRTDVNHGLEIVGYDIPALEIAANGRNIIPFTAKKQGTFQIRCQLHPAHRPGVLIVE